MLVSSAFGTDGANKSGEKKYGGSEANLYIGFFNTFSWQSLVGSDCIKFHCVTSESKQLLSIETCMVATVYQHL